MGIAHIYTSFLCVSSIRSFSLFTEELFRIFDEEPETSRKQKTSNNKAAVSRLLALTTKNIENVKYFLSRRSLVKPDSYAYHTWLDTTRI